MIFGIRQPGEVRTHGPADDLPVGIDDGLPLGYGDLAGPEALGASLAAQLTMTGRTQVARPLGLAVWRYQVAAARNLDRNDRHLAGHASTAPGYGQRDGTASADPHHQRVEYPARQRGRLEVRHGDLPFYVLSGSYAGADPVRRPRAFVLSLTAAGHHLSGKAGITRCWGHEQSR